jgi:bifunctional polynucleotide phosphatase/kinase
MIIYKNYYTANISKMDKIASFDLDHTLIRPKSGNIFPKNLNDWEFMPFPTLKTKLEKLSSDHLVVIFSNQKKTFHQKYSDDEFLKKIDKIHSKLGIDFIFVAALEDDNYRKPRIGMYEHLIEKEGLTIKKEDSFFVGDMAGRKNDKYDTDLKFAKNIGIQFMTPEEYFLNQSSSSYNIRGYKLDNNSKNYDNLLINISPQKKVMVVISGYPGSGKSHLANKLAGNKSTIISKDNFGNKFNKKLKESLKDGNYTIVEGLYSNNMSRKKLKELASKYNYNTKYIMVNTSYNLSYHLNIYRSLYKNKKKIPEVVYMKYKKEFEYPLEEDWDEIINYHPHIPRKVNKMYLY